MKKKQSLVSFLKTRTWEMDVQHRKKQVRHMHDMEDYIDKRFHNNVLYTEMLLCLKKFLKNDK